MVESQSPGMGVRFEIAFAPSLSRCFGVATPDQVAGSPVMDVSSGPACAVATRRDAFLHHLSPDPDCTKTAVSLLHGMHAQRSAKAWMTVTCAHRCQADGTMPCGLARLNALSKRGAYMSHCRK